MPYFVLPVLLFKFERIKLSRLGKKELGFLLSITCNFVVSVRRSFLFLYMLRIFCVISL